MNISFSNPNISLNKQAAKFSGTILKPLKRKPRVRQYFWNTFFKGFRPVRIGRTYDISSRQDKVVWATGPDALGLRSKLREVQDLEQYRAVVSSSSSPTREYQVSEVDKSIERLKDSYFSTREALMTRAREDVLRFHFRMY